MQNVHKVIAIVSGLHRINSRWGRPCWDFETKNAKIESNTFTFPILSRVKIDTNRQSYCHHRTDVAYCYIRMVIFPNQREHDLIRFNLGFPLEPIYELYKDAPKSSLGAHCSQKNNRHKFMATEARFCHQRQPYRPQKKKNSKSVSSIRNGALVTSDFRNSIVPSHLYLAIHFALHSILESGQYW